MDINNLKLVSSVPLMAWLPSKLIWLVEQHGCLRVYLEKLGGYWKTRWCKNSSGTSRRTKFVKNILCILSGGLIRCSGTTRKQNSYTGSRQCQKCWKNQKYVSPCLQTNCVSLQISTGFDWIHLIPCTESPRFHEYWPLPKSCSC